MGLKFKVNKNVLIPRQETELLTQAVLEIGKSCNKKNILDLCCGSGAISISLSKLGSFNKITACDISLKAIDIAKKNALLNKAKNISFIQSDLFSSLKSRRFDIIVSNPPYISPQEFKNLEPELNFEPKKSLVAKDKGLYFYKQIAELAPKYLNPNAFVLLELNSNLSNQRNF
jgi:release factor glutamine methyltransferase